MTIGVLLGFILISIAERQRDPHKTEQTIKQMVFFGALMSVILSISYSIFGIINGQQNFYTTFFLFCLSGSFSLSTISNCTFLMQRHTNLVHEAITVGSTYWVANISGISFVYILTYCIPSSSMAILIWKINSEVLRSSDRGWSDLDDHHRLLFRENDRQTKKHQNHPNRHGKRHCFDESDP